MRRSLQLSTRLRRHRYVIPLSQCYCKFTAINTAIVILRNSNYIPDGHLSRSSDISENGRRQRGTMRFCDDCLQIQQLIVLYLFGVLHTTKHTTARAHHLTTRKENHNYICHHPGWYNKIICCSIVVITHPNYNIILVYKYQCFPVILSRGYIVGYL